MYLSAILAAAPAILIGTPLSSGLFAGAAMVQPPQSREIRFCETVDMTTDPADGWGSIIAAGDTHANSRFAVEITEQGDLFPPDVAYFDGQSGMLFLRNGFAVRLRFGDGPSMTVSEAALSCERVQEAPVRKRSDRKGLPDFPRFKIMDVERTISGDRIVLYADHENAESFIWIAPASSAGRKLVELDFAADVVSYAPSPDSPLKAVDVIARGDGKSKILWQRIGWMKGEE